MRSLFLIFGLLLFLNSCKEESKDNDPTIVPKVESSEALTVAERIAQAHGIKYWNNVSQIEFTFNVNRESGVFQRSWIWKPKTDEVTLISTADTIHYFRNDMDSEIQKTDASFINDKYWLLAPFQLVWDKDAKLSSPVEVEAPLSKLIMNKVTLTYGNEGGYTPGDAYDLYYNHEYQIQEWTYRKSNSPEPSLQNTWEGYKDFDGLTISTMHKQPNSDWKLYFTDVKVTMSSK